MGRASDRISGGPLFDPGLIHPLFLLGEPLQGTFPQLKYWFRPGRHGDDRRRVSVLYTEHVKEPEDSVGSKE